MVVPHRVRDRVPADGPVTALGNGGTRTGGLLILVATTIANLLGYLLALVASRQLGPSEFGALAALLGLVLVGFVVALGLQAVTARRIAAGVPDDLSGLTETAVLASGVTGVAGLAAAVPFAAFLHVGVAGPALAALSLVPLTWTGFVQGLTQGARRFRQLAAVIVIAAIGKVGGGLIGVLVVGTPTGAMAATAAGAAGAAVVVSVLTRRLLPPLAGRRIGGWETAHATHALLALFALTNADLLLARHVLSATEAGLYGVGAVLTKGAFWLPQFVVVVAFPRLAVSEQRTHALRVSVAALAGAGLTVTALAAVAGELAVRLVGGSAYLALAPHAWLFVALGSSYAMVQLLLYGRLAGQDRLSVLAVWAALLVLVSVVLGQERPSVTSVAATALGCALALVLVGLLRERRTLLSGRRASRHQPAGQGPGL